MVFIAVVIAVALVRFTSIRMDIAAAWLINSWERAINGVGALPPVARYYLYLAVPLTVVALLLLLFHARGWQAAEFLLSFTVLLGCIHEGHLKEEIKRFTGDLDRGDLQAAYHDAAAFREGESPAANWRELHADSLAAIAGRYFQCYFPAIFWFAMLGAPGALLYRLAWYGAGHGAGRTGGSPAAPVAGRLLTLLEWLPLRLLGFTLALMGNFSVTFSRWRASVLTLRTSTGILLRGYIQAALHHPGGSDGAETEIDELDELADLVDRSLVSWLAVLALLTLVV